MEGGALGVRGACVKGPHASWPPTPSYDSNLNASRDDKKNKFASTMEFVEDYLNNVVSEAVPFANEEKNKLTYEVGRGQCAVGCWSVESTYPLAWRSPPPAHQCRESA